MLVLFITVSLIFVQNAHCMMMAKAKVYAESSTNIVGYVMFIQKNADSPVKIRGEICNMTADTVHGFHVHQYSISDGKVNCTAAGTHFNPYGTTHGPITANIMNRHVGDLGNVTSDGAGKIKINMEDSIIQLYNATQSIANRTIVLHAMRDDGGMGGFPDSTTTGNAGARIACGNIMLKDKWSKH